MPEYGNRCGTVYMTPGSNDGPPPPYPEHLIKDVIRLLQFNFDRTWPRYPELVEWVGRGVDVEEGRRWKFFQAPVTPAYTGDPLSPERVIDTWDYVFGWYVDTERPVEEWR